MAIRMSSKKIYYSDKYADEEFEYKHVLLPKSIAKLVPKTHLMSEVEWRGIGVQQSHGWIHYMKHDPEYFFEMEASHEANIGIWPRHGDIQLNSL